MADMYSGGSTSAIASSAPERGKGGSADAISMSAAEVTRRLAAWISPHRGFLVLAAVSSIATVILQLWVPIIVGSAIDSSSGWSRAPRQHFCLRSLSSHW